MIWMWRVLAFVCIVLGIIAGFVGGNKLLFDALDWFVLSIAFSLLELDLSGFSARPGGVKNGR